MASSIHNDHCGFCQEIRLGSVDRNIAEQYRCESRIFWHSPLNLVMPSVGPLAPGHVLVVPRDHVRNSRALPTDHKQDILELLSKTELFLSNTFRSGVYVFEHGIPTDQEGGGCGVDHAHIHLLPISSRSAHSVNSRVLNSLLVSNGSMKFSSIQVRPAGQIIEQDDSAGAYLLFGTMD